MRPLGHGQYVEKFRQLFFEKSEMPESEFEPVSRGYHVLKIC